MKRIFSAPLTHDMGEIKITVETTHDSYSPQELIVLASKLLEHHMRVLQTPIDTVGETVEEDDAGEWSLT